MIVRALRNAVLALLTTDATFVAAVAALLAVDAATISGVTTNKPLDEIEASAGPVWVIEIGDGTSAAISNEDAGQQTIGLSQQTFRQELHVALVWIEDSRDAAADARADLPVLLTQLFLRNPTPAGIDGATVTDFSPDKGGNHPNQVWRAVVACDVTFPRA